MTEVSAPSRIRPAAGTRLAWIVDPVARTVESYCDPHPPAYVGLALFIVLVAGPLLVNVMLVRVALRKR